MTKFQPHSRFWTNAIPTNLVRHHTHSGNLNSIASNLHESAFLSRFSFFEAKDDRINANQIYRDESVIIISRVR